MEQELAEAQENEGELQKTIKALEDELEELKESFENTKNNIRKSGVKTKAILNDDLVKALEDAVKNIAFRTWKFVEDQKDLDSCTEESINYLKVPLPGSMDATEFVRDYGTITNEGLKAGRQYVQSEGKKRAQGKYIV